MKQRDIFLFALVALFVAACGTIRGEAAAPADESLPQPELPFAQELQDALDLGLSRYGGKGVSAAVIMPGYRTWLGVSGVSHGTQPITTETVFDAGSIQKMFTAAAVLQLSEEGVLSLDDRLGKWLPSYPNVDPDITLRQLLNHTGGVFDMVRHPAYWESMSADVTRVWEPEEILKHFLLEPYFPSGEGWHYSTSGYIMLRLIIEEATGSDLASVHRTRFFNPLGLENTYLAVYEELPENTAHGWFDVNGDGEYDDVPQFISFNSSSAGAVFTNPADLATWLQALFEEGRVLSEPLLAQALEFQPTTPDEPLGAGYGLGIASFSPEIFNGLKIWGHSGNAAGYAAGAFYLPDYRIVVVLMGNTEKGEFMGAMNDLLRITTEHNAPGQ